MTSPGAVGSMRGWSGRPKNVLHWLLPASSGDGAGGFSVLPSALRPNNYLARSGGSEVVEAIIEAAGAFLLTGGISLFLTWTAYHMWQISPPQRFRRLEEGLIIAYNQLHSHGQKPEDISEIRSAIRRLDKFQIPHPGMQGRALYWLTFLRRLIGEARAGADKEARLVWSQSKEQRELANEADT